MKNQITNNFRKHKYIYTFIVLTFLIFNSFLFVTHIKNISAQTNQGAAVTYSGASSIDSAGSTYNVLIDSGTNKIGFVKLILKFDQTKLKLTSNPQVNQTFTNFAIAATDLASANSTGQYRIDVGVAPQNQSSAPSGSFTFLTVSFQPVNSSSSQSALSFDSQNIQIVDMNATNISATTADKTVNVNPTIPGDIDGNGSVNIQDYILLSNAFGSTNQSADLNHDGTVNIQDYIILSNNFGN